MDIKYFMYRCDVHAIYIMPRIITYTIVQSSEYKKYIHDEVPPMKFIIIMIIAITLRINLIGQLKIINFTDDVFM